jgi:hypothetical protein
MLDSSSRQQALASQRCRSVVVEKARQAAKIGQIAEALALEGIANLDQQAKALGLARSTAWTILVASHKSTGISAKIIDRMLSAPALPASVRAKIIEYAQEKAAGLHGHGEVQRRRFIGQLAAKLAERGHWEDVILLQRELENQRDRGHLKIFSERDAK